MHSVPLRIVILLGSSPDAAVPYIERVCHLPDVEVCGVLLDTHGSSWKIRFRNLQRNLKREGFGYLFYRAGYALRGWLEGCAEAIAPTSETRALLSTAFPSRCFTLEDLADRHGFPVHEAGSLNSEIAVGLLRRLNADLGIVLGTRVLKRTTFSVPAYGSINLHKGKVPEFRGMPPGFWEIYEGASSAGVTVHFIDDGLDTGNVVATAEIPIHPLENPRSLQHKLDAASVETLAAAVTKIAWGDREGIPQSGQAGKTSVVRCKS